MNVFYHLTSTFGWAEIQFTHNNFSRTYSVEYCLGDNLNELLGGLIAVSKYRTETKIIDDITNRYMDNPDDDIFEWVACVGGASAKFIFKPLDTLETINLKIIEYGYNDKDEECVFNEDINLPEFIDGVLLSCEELIKKYGILGYYENFWVEFPVSYFLILKNYKERKIKYSTISEIIENKTEELHKTNIKVEKFYLKTI
jgi:hypothetical protein